MFAFMSLLVEQKYFETVEMNFLIVGHTHASIDQFFSVVKSLIDDVNFIGSPLALLELLKAQKEDSPLGSILVARSIDIVYDVVTAFEPIINKRIKVRITS